MKPLYDVCTIGAATRDFFLRSKDFRIEKDRSGRFAHVLSVPLGSKIDIRSLVVTTGGGATNAAATFASLGLRTAFFGKVGKDDDGAAIIRDLKNRGIDCHNVRQDPRGITAVSVLLSTRHFGRTVLVYRGASHDYQRSDIPIATVRTRWLYVTSLGGDCEILSWITRTARARRIPVLCNPGAGELRRPHQLIRALRTVSILLCNREEASRLIQQPSRGLPTPLLLRRIARRLPDTTIIVTDEARGAWAYAKRELFHSGVHRSVRVVERTGAGDAFGSGMLAGLLASHGDLAYALKVGTANAESVMKNVGAKNDLLTSLPRSASLVPVTRRHVAW
jgi:sugar/nucleoside kinase (ribokinase family)